MSLKGLRFTLEVDGQEPDTFAVVNFRLIQNQSYPFVMSVDVASDSFMQTAEMLLEKNATLTIWQGVIPQRYVTGVVAGFGMQENNGWQMRYHLRIEPPLWRGAGAAELPHLPAAGYPDDIGHITERERRHRASSGRRCFMRTIRRGSSVSSTGKATWRFWRGCGRRRGFSSLSGLRRTVRSRS